MTDSGNDLIEQETLLHLLIENGLGCPLAFFLRRPKGVFFLIV